MGFLTQLFSIRAIISESIPKYSWYLKMEFQNIIKKKFIHKIKVFFQEFLIRIKNEFLPRIQKSNSL